MLSPARLIYDYAESLGRCKSVKANLPYFQIQRFKFFFVTRDKSAEHIIFNVDNLELDENSEYIHSNMDRYSLSEYNREQVKLEAGTQFSKLKVYVAKSNIDNKKSKDYLIDLFDNWSSDLEGEYESIKQNCNYNSCFNLVDYIKYKYENNMTDLSYDDFVDVLSILNDLIKRSNIK